MGGLLALRSCGFPWCPPCPTVMLCEERPRCTHPGLGCTYLPIAKTRQPHPCSPGSLGRTSLPCAHRDQLVWHKCWPCAKPWAAPD